MYTCVRARVCKKVSSNIVQSPVIKTAQSAFTMYFPGTTVQSNTVSTFLGSIQTYPTINAINATRTYSHHCL